MGDDLMRMQRQAAHRVQQMQDHSRRVFEAHQGRAPEGLSSPGLYTHPGPAEDAPAPPPCPPEPPVAPWDGEQWLILGLAALLWRCGCHTELMLALLYLAL